VRASIDRRAMGLLSGGHLAVDFAQGAVPAMLPFLVTRFDLSYTLAAVLMLAVTLSSSVVQPLFGVLSDGRGALWLLPGGLVVAGVGIALAALSPGFWLVVLWVTVAGVGIAAYHPEGAKFAAFASGDHRAKGMSLFNVGGNLGYALGPVVVTPFIVWFGLGGGLVSLVPVTVLALLLVRATPHLRSLEAPAAARTVVAGTTDRWGAMAVLGTIIAMRSVAWFGLITFVPLWWISKGHSESAGNHLLSAMLLCGAVGTIVVGRFADRVGLRRTMIVTQAALGPLVLVFVLVGGPVGITALALVGTCVVGTFGVTLVLSQAYLPQRVGLASGLAIGLAMGLGGIAAISLGAVADAIDLRTAMLASAGAPVIGLLLCLVLPDPGGRPERARHDRGEEPVRYPHADRATSAGGGST
jgi:MFS transporter, FSR family, fosmidomycin resistance protein